MQKLQQTYWTLPAYIKHIKPVLVSDSHWWKSSI